MHIGLAGAAGAALIMLVGSPVQAGQDEAGAAGQEEASLDQLTDLFARLSAALGYEIPPPPQSAFNAALAAALPNRPEGETRTWGNAFSIDFDIRDDTDVTDPPYDDIVDARNCPMGERGREVADFRRISRHGMTGYQCTVVHIGDETGDDLWAVSSTAMAQRGARAVTIQYGGLLAIGDDPEATRALGDDRLGANVALARALADYAIDAWGQAAAPDGSPGIGEMSERLFTALEEIGGDVMDAPSQPVPLADGAPTTVENAG